MQPFPKSFKLTTLVALLSFMAAVPALAQSQTGAAHGKAVAAKAPFPSLRFNESSNGEAALAKLGANLPAVAAFYGKTPAEFAKQLRIDKTARIDKAGRMYYVEAALTTSGSNLAPSNAIYPLEQTFALHSRPGSKRKIYLDFNGHTTTGTEWNTLANKSTIVSPPWDTDGVPGTFSASELSRIQNVWRIVAEDYAPFDVDVTTEEPPADQMTRMPWPFNDDTYGMRAVITNTDFATGTAVNCNSCGGVAFVGGFDETNETHKPAFAFPRAFYSDKDIADTISHEIGHTAGLGHDGTSTAGYYDGHNTTIAGGWSPIMGAGYRTVTQFSKGEYPDANNKEDDYQVMHNNGVQFVADDFGNTIAAARSLDGTVLNGTSTYDARGLIETPADVDVFKFAATPGTAIITVAPFEISPNLDIHLEVRDAYGNLLASDNPFDTMSASASVYIPTTGTYYVSIQGMGDRVPAIHTSDYGSLGRYNFRVTAPLVATPPTCAITATVYRNTDMTRISVSGAKSTDAFGAIQSYQWDWGDGTGYGSNVTASHSYFESGTYYTTLKVTSASGLSTSCRYTTIVSVTGVPR